MQPISLARESLTQDMQLHDIDQSGMTMLQPQAKMTVDDGTSMLMDRIRGVSALVVACAHSIQFFLLPYFGLGTHLHILSSLAATYAVMAFFTVSGFMIYVSVRRHTVNGRLEWTSYARARVLRIYPPLLASVAVTFAVYLLIRGLNLHGAESFRLAGDLFVVRERAEFDLPSLLATFALSYGVVPNSPPPLSINGPLWTLGYEFWFYFLTMFALNALAGRKFSGVLSLAVMVAMLIIGWNWLLLVFLLIWLSGFGLGCAYERQFLFGRGAGLVLSAVVVAACGCIIWVSGPRLMHNILQPYDGKEAEAVMVFVGVMFTALLGLSIKARIAARQDWMVMASRFSYTLYVVHFPLLLLAFSLLHPLLHAYGWGVSAFAGLVILALIIAVAERLSCIVENRLMISRAWDHWVDRLSRWQHGKSTPR
jgi:peptidoglycan/LPS O-acetylase OafA/YrhL